MHCRAQRFQGAASPFSYRVAADDGGADPRTGKLWPSEYMGLRRSRSRRVQCALCAPCWHRLRSTLQCDGINAKGFLHNASAQAGPLVQEHVDSVAYTAVAAHSANGEATSPCARHCEHFSTSTTRTTLKVVRLGEVDVASKQRRGEVDVSDIPC
jgi:hypothetical protein